MGHVHELEQRLAQTAHNARKPPSSDPPSVPPRPPKTARGRKAGGHVGHVGATRERRKPDQMVPCYPHSCPDSHTLRADRLPDAAPVMVTHVWERDTLQPVVTDYHPHTRCGPQGQVRVTASAPEDAVPGYGPRVTALIGHLHGRYHLR